MICISTISSEYTINSAMTRRQTPFNNMKQEECAQAGNVGEWDTVGQRRAFLRAAYFAGAGRGRNSERLLPGAERSFRWCWLWFYGEARDD